MCTAKESNANNVIRTFQTIERELLKKNVCNVIEKKFIIGSICADVRRRYMRYASVKLKTNELDAVKRIVLPKNELKQAIDSFMDNYKDIFLVSAHQHITSTLTERFIEVMSAHGVV
jgi:hypothetical protein